MTNDHGQVQSFPDSVYRSKRDAWIVIILWLVIIFALASAIYVPFAESSMVAVVFQEILMLGTAAFCYSILRWTDYTLKGADLTVRSGPIRSTIPISDIGQVLPSRSAWSSVALSLDRLQIILVDSRTAAYISPQDKTGFLRDLAARSPDLRFEDDRVLRVGP